MDRGRTITGGRLRLVSAGWLAASLVAVGATVAPASATTAAALPAGCTGTSPITCHYDVKPGHYDVTVVVGDDTAAGHTTMLAEARRVMLPTVVTAGGQLTRYTVTVNVRRPEGQPTGQGGTGTDGLDLVFGGRAPKLDAISVTAARPPVLYLAGDSTVCDQPKAPYSGWGQQLPQYFKPGLSVANYGDSGESSGSFVAKKSLFGTMQPLITGNDHVLIQLAHNDGKATKAAYQANLVKLVDGVRARGGVPVLVTPPVRRWFTGNRLNSTGLIVNGAGVDLPAAMRQVAAAKNVPLIDLTAKSRALVEKLGPAGSGKIYLTKADDGVNDKTHFSDHGANEMAKLVLEGAREAKLTALTAFLR